jgi:hypothetical protein
MLSSVGIKIFLIKRLKWTEACQKQTDKKATRMSSLIEFRKL